MEKLVYRDMFDNVIKVGDYLAYPDGGSPAEILVGKVLAISERPVEYGQGMRPAITIWGAYTRYGNDPELNTKPGILQFHERTIIISQMDLPDRFLTLLEDLQLK